MCNFDNLFRSQISTTTKVAAQKTEADWTHHTGWPRCMIGHPTGRRPYYHTTSARELWQRIRRRPRHGRLSEPQLVYDNDNVVEMWCQIFWPYFKRITSWRKYCRSVLGTASPWRNNISSLPKDYDERDGNKADLKRKFQQARRNCTSNSADDR